jgi:endonuclease/exonuclease/phosphatase family metal-dependent hydrolase
MTGKPAFRAIAACGFALAWAGLLCRGRDGGVVPAVLYYATPWLLRLLAALLALLAFRHWGTRAMAITCAVVSLLEGWQSLRLDALPAIPARAPLVSVWNAGRALDRKPSAWPALARADVSAVVECGTFSGEEWRRFTAASPDHEWRRFDGSTMLGVRGKIVSHESLGVHDLFRCHRVRVALPDHGELTVVVADVRSQPWISRGQALAAIVRAAGDDPRAIIVGDFNTPPESRGFREWREKGFTLANDGPRRGFRETWAYGLPLWTLDHVWVGRGWNTLRVGHSRHGSDHARVEVVLSP